MRAGFWWSCDGCAGAGAEMAVEELQCGDWKVSMIQWRGWALQAVAVGRMPGGVI